MAISEGHASQSRACHQAPPTMAPGVWVNPHTCNEEEGRYLPYPQCSDVAMALCLGPCVSEVVRSPALPEAVSPGTHGNGAAALASVVGRMLRLPVAGFGSLLSSDGRIYGDKRAAKNLKMMYIFHAVS